MSRKKRGKAPGASFAPGPTAQIPMPEPAPASAQGPAPASAAEPAQAASAPEPLESAASPTADGAPPEPDAAPAPPDARPSAPPEPRAALARADTPIVGTDTPITGEILKRVRESKGVTLKEISDKTRIGRRNLEALEEERFDELPDAKIYIRGFVRCLALELGLDPERVTTSYLVRWDHWYEGQNFPKKRALRGRP